MGLGYGSLSMIYWLEPRCNLDNRLKLLKVDFSIYEILGAITDVDEIMYYLVHNMDEPDLVVEVRQLEFNISDMNETAESEVRSANCQGYRTVHEVEVVMQLKHVVEEIWLEKIYNNIKHVLPTYQEYVEDMNGVEIEEDVEFYESNGNYNIENDSSDEEGQTIRRKKSN
ncbi:conserved hypothetical protein [Ricinus communis]|uniref:Uncharacterized protein n=1 Tax=Ricinus communis TaxID=3988 RepID=B9SP50_RICCO|nr:conserved hypothetical protein [Ricinus communis]